MDANILSDHQKLLEKAKAYDQLRELMGHIQNGSDTTVTLSQDDATRSFIVKVGNQRFHGGDLQSALHLAATGE